MHIKLTLYRHSQDDMDALKSIINAIIYRPFQLRFKREIAPPDQWTLIITDCNQSAIEKTKASVDAICKLYGTKYDIKVF